MTIKTGQTLPKHMHSMQVPSSNAEINDMPLYSCTGFARTACCKQLMMLQTHVYGVPYVLAQRMTAQHLAFVHL